MWLAAWTLLRAVPVWLYAIAALSLGVWVQTQRLGAATDRVAGLRAEAKATSMAQIKASDQAIKASTVADARERAKEQDWTARHEQAQATYESELAASLDVRADLERTGRMRDAAAAVRRRAASDPGQAATFATCSTELAATGELLAESLRAGAACTGGAEAVSAVARSLRDGWPVDASKPSIRDSGTANASADR